MCLTETRFSEDASYHTLNVCKLFLKTSPQRWTSETRGTLTVRVRFPHLTCERAEKLGANAIIGIDVDYEVLGEKNGMLMVSVSGTAVVVK